MGVWENEKCHVRVERFYACQVDFPHVSMVCGCHVDGKKIPIFLSSFSFFLFQKKTEIKKS